MPKKIKFEAFKNQFLQFKETIKQSFIHLGLFKKTEKKF